MTAAPADLCRWTGKQLAPAQLEAAVAPLEPGLIIAGAGTGKTTVMAARVTWLVATGEVRPDEVLGLTFTTKAAGELTRRVREAVAKARALQPAGPDDAGEPTISTYHAFANSLVVEHGPLVGAEPTSRVLTGTAVRQLAHRVLCRTSLEFEGDQRSLKELVKGITALDSALAEHDVDPRDLVAADGRLIEQMLPHVQQLAGQEIIATARKRRDLAALVLELRAAKAELMVIDFADQLRWASRVAAEHPSVGEALRQRYRVVLLDEYQDTSVTQRRLMQHLFGGGHPVTAVGDPFQAIYGFRGASVRNIERFPQHFPRADGQPATTYALVENRRSRQEILDVANAIAAPLREGTGIQPLVAASQPMGPAAGAASQPTGRAAEAASQPTGRFPTAEILSAFLDTEDAEHAWVAEQVVRLHHAGHPWSDITVLLRAMTGVGRLRDALAAREVPVEVVGVEGLIALPEVVEVISTLRLLHDPTSNPDCARLLSGARWRVGPRDLALLGRRASELADGARRSRGLGVEETLEQSVAGTDPVDLVCLLDALDDLGPGPISAQGRERMRQFSAEMRSLRRHVGEPLADLVQRVLDTTGLEAEVRAQPEAEGLPRLASLSALITLAAEFRDLDGRSTLGGFLRFLADARRFDASPEAVVPSATDSVRIMTAHKSKGLEFPVVVLPSLVEGAFPTKNVMSTWTSVPTAVPFALRDEEPPGDLPRYPNGLVPTSTERTAYREAVRELTDSEETRLAYVAVTRAETTLVASGARWALSGATTPREPSRYLLAIQQACLEGRGTVDQWSEHSEFETNPLASRPSAAWPVAADAERLEARRVASAAVLSRLGGVAGIDACARPAHDPDGLVAGWDADLAALLAEAEHEGRLERAVAIPDSLSTTSLLRLVDDEEAFALDLVRPMPRRPSPAARRGTRFHAWVETFWGQQPLLEPDDLPGAADADIDSDDELEAIKERFQAMEYATLTPVALEEPFAVVLGGRVVSGRIDAVFRHRHPSGDPALDRWEVVDWKTSRAVDADPLQLAVYRLAWAELQGVPLDRVDAAFAYVRLGEVVRYGAHPHPPLPDRAGLARLLNPLDG